jgi:peroxiredoxin family protein
MPGMRRGLTLIVAGDDPQRFDAAVALAAAEAAIGGTVRLYAHRLAVRRLGDLALVEAMDAGVAVMACQTGLAEAGIDLTMLDPRIEGGGMVGLLLGLGDDRLILG